VRSELQWWDDLALVRLALISGNRGQDRKKFWLICVKDEAMLKEYYFHSFLLVVGWFIFDLAGDK
jgi:hypothetical protein